MQPVAINIGGEFWDSQIYQGRLYLFCCDGSIRTFDWDHLVRSLKVRASLRLALECAFLRSDYLYGSYWELFFADADIRRIVLSKFQRLSSKSIEIDEKQLSKSRIDTQDNPFPFPHADSTIYKLRMYVTGRSGVWSGNCNKRTKHPVSSRPNKEWDCPSVSVAASYDSLALSAGDEGLWQLGLTDFPFGGTRKPKRIAEHPCDGCEWMFHSIYGSSYDSGGFLAEFEKANGSDSDGSFVRTFSQIVSDRSIFHDEGYSWGTKDKIYLAQKGSIRIARYNPYDKYENFLDVLDNIPIAPWKGDFVSGGVSTYGAILEYDNAIVVIPSEGSPITLPGEPVNWRVFPNSRFYQNHLHIVYEDKVTIHSFNHDYFVKQADKLFGTKPELEWTVRRRNN